MRRKTIIIATVVALAAALAACGSNATPAESASASVTNAAAPTLVPVFDRQAFIMRDAATDLPVYEASSRFSELEPLFTASGAIRRCEVTDAPLYLSRLANHPVVVRIRRN